MQNSMMAPLAAYYNHLESFIQVSTPGPIPYHCKLLLGRDPGMLVLKAPVVSQMHNGIKNPWKIIFESHDGGLGRKDWCPSKKKEFCLQAAFTLELLYQPFPGLQPAKSGVDVNFMLSLAVSAFGLPFTPKCDCKKENFKSDNLNFKYRINIVADWKE